MNEPNLRTRGPELDEVQQPMPVPRLKPRSARPAAQALCTCWLSLGLGCGGPGAAAQQDASAGSDAAQDAVLDAAPPFSDTGWIANSDTDARNAEYQPPRTDLDAGVCVTLEDGHFAEDACHACTAILVRTGEQRTVDASCGEIRRCVRHPGSCYAVNLAWCEDAAWHSYGIQSCP